MTWQRENSKIVHQETLQNNRIIPTKRHCTCKITLKALSSTLPILNKSCSTPERVIRCTRKIAEVVVLEEEALRSVAPRAQGGLSPWQGLHGDLASPPPCMALLPCRGFKNHNVEQSGNKLICFFREMAPRPQWVQGCICISSGQPNTNGAQLRSWADFISKTQPAISLDLINSRQGMEPEACGQAMGTGNVPQLSLSSGSLGTGGRSQASDFPPC